MNLQFEQPFEYRQTAEVRAESPVDSRLVFQRGDLTGGPVFYVDDVRIPREVAPGGTVAVEVDVTNERRTVTPLNDAYCDTGGFVSAEGLAAEIAVTPEWLGQTDTQSVCVAGAVIRPTTETLVFEYEAPSTTGSYTVEIVGDSGTGGGQVSYETAVVEDGETSPGGDSRSDGDDDSDKVIDVGDEIGILELLGISQTTAGLAVLVLVLLLLLSVSLR